MNEHRERYEKLMWELGEILLKLNPWYSVDRITFHSVEVWGRNDWWSKNVFDITPNGVHYYEGDHAIPDEAWPIIRMAQDKMNEVQDYVFDHADAFSNGKWLKNACRLVYSYRHIMHTDVPVSGFLANEED